MSSLPKTYKAAVFEKNGGPLVLKDIELKHPEEGQILVKVEACGVCHSDALVQSEAFGPLPRIPGHEIVGKVVEVGPHVTKWKQGDRVGGAWHGGHDGTCRQCNQGLFQMCDNGQINGVTRDGGCKCLDPGPKLYAAPTLFSDDSLADLPVHLLLS